jgi:hypothetical protein
VVFLSSSRQIPRLDYDRFLSDPFWFMTYYIAFDAVYSNNWQRRNSRILPPQNKQTNKQTNENSVTLLCSCQFYQ